MASDTSLPDLSPVGHLKKCTECATGVITVPRLCEGKSNEDHKDWWMESCSNFIRPTTTHCSNMNWREDLGKGPLEKGTKGGPCPGVLCRDLPKPKGINVRCYYGLCQPCCKHAQLSVPSLHVCRVQTHRPPRGGPQHVDTIEPVTSGSTTQIANASGNLGPSVSIPAQASTSLSPAFPTAASTSASTVVTLRQLELQQIELAEHAATQQSDTVNANKTIFVYWWPENDQPRKVYEIVAPYFPKWHPKDSPELVKLYHVDKDMFEWWDTVRWDWVTASPTTARRDVSHVRNTRNSGGPASELHYRSLGVLHADGMPTRAVRRRADSSPEPDGSSEQASPTKRIRSITPGSWNGSGPPTPHTLSRSATPSELGDIGSLSDADAVSEYGGSEYDYPPSSDGGSSRFSSRAPSMAPSISTGSWLSPTREYAYGPSTPSSRRVSPATTALSLATPGSSGSSQPSSRFLTPIDTVLPTQPRVFVLDENTEFDPNAPRAHSKAGWPLKYVIDMAIGFHVLRRRTNAGMPRPIAFEDLFGCKYNSSTWSDNFRAFEAASAISGEIDSWAAHGRQSAGEWSKFMSKWRRGRKHRG